MAVNKTITIVGGGLAGLTLGIELRRRLVPVKIFEAGSYPRHRVCGEFISGHGQETLLGMGIQLMDHGARQATTAAFYAKEMTEVKFILPTPAICISRFFLDNLLAQEFIRLGGELHERQRFQTETDDQKGLVHAEGRHLQAVVNGWRWYGLKVHAKGIEMQADLEVHLTKDGYVGLCRLQNEVNICGLFRSKTTVPDLARQWKNQLRGDTELEMRLKNAEFDESSFCSVAGLNVEPRNDWDTNRCELGDAFNMITPVTGNGMSMAFESAELATIPLAHYSQGEFSWKMAVDQVKRNCEQRFTSRLKWADRLHKTMFNQYGYDLLLLLLPRFRTLPELLFSQTR